MKVLCLEFIIYRHKALEIANEDRVINRILVRARLRKDL